MTFKQFAADVAAIADHLGKLGVARGDRVAILDVNSLNFLESLCALGVMGAVAVPLNYRQRVPEYRFQIEDSGARLLLANSRYAAEAMTAAGFQECYNVAGGFEGDPDDQGHRGTVNGWKVDGLPWRQR